jgi:hypothetical protein
MQLAASPSESSLLHFGASPGQNAQRAGAIPPRRDAACCVSGMRFAASPAESQIRTRSSASQPTRMARAKVSRSECHVCDGVTGRDGPDLMESVFGRKLEDDEVGPERQRLPPEPDRPAMDGSEQAERAKAISRAAEVGRRRTAVPFAGTRVLRRQATATQLRHRASGDGAEETGREAIPGTVPATPGPAQ